MNSPSIDFAPAKGSTSKAPYHSPTPGNIGAPVADMVVLAHIAGHEARQDMYGFLRGRCQLHCLSA